MIRTPGKTGGWAPSDPDRQGLRLAERPASGEQPSSPRLHHLPPPPPAPALPHRFLVPFPLQLSHHAALPSSHQEGAAESSPRVGQQGAQALSRPLTWRPVFRPRSTLQDPPVPPDSLLTLPTQCSTRFTPPWQWVRFGLVTHPMILTR